MRKYRPMISRLGVKVWDKIEKRIGKFKTNRRQKHFTYMTRRIRIKSKLTIHCMAYQSEFDTCDEDGDNKEPRQVHFDTDAKDLRVDNGASKCISSYIEDFIDIPRPVNKSIIGIGGILTHNMEGTVEWQIQDDDGRTHTIRIPNTLYSPQAGVRILSPQHWAQVAKDHKPLKRGTWSGTYHDCIELWWHQGEFKRTVPLNPNETNVGTIKTAPGYTRYHVFAAEVGEPEGDGFDEDMIQEPMIVSDDEEEWFDEDDNERRETPLTTEFDLNGIKDIRGRGGRRRRRPHPTKCIR